MSRSFNKTLQNRYCSIKQNKKYVSILVDGCSEVISGTIHGRLICFRGSEPSMEKKGYGAEPVPSIINFEVIGIVSTYEKDPSILNSQRRDTGEMQINFESRRTTLQN